MRSGPSLEADLETVALRLLGFELEQRPAILDRHHLHETRQIAVPALENGAGAGRMGVFEMTAKQFPDALGIAARHVGRDIDKAVMLEIAAMMVEALDRLLFGRHGCKIDNGEVAAAREVAGLVEDVGDAARHAGGEVAPGRADDQDDAAGHVFAAMVADALDHGDGTGIAHGEALAANAA